MLTLAKQEAMICGGYDDDDDGVKFKIKMVTIHLTNIVVRTSITVRLTET